MLLFLAIMGAILFGAWLEDAWHPGRFFEETVQDFREWLKGGEE